MAKEHSYFQAYDGYFWQWEDKGELIAIPGGTTIIYEKYLTEIMGHLHPQGLPPLGALLLALIATGSDGRTSLEYVKDIVTYLQPPNDDKLAEAMAFLKLLTEMPGSFKEGSKRLLLLQVLFGRCHGILSVKESIHIYEQYRKGTFNGKAAPLKPATLWLFDLDFRTIALIKRRFKGVEDIIHRVAGLPDPQQIPIELEETPRHEDAAADADLIEQLTLHPKTFAVGSLVRWMWSGLNIPAHSALPSQQPLGGVSDLTNKGEYHRLLISEFANDDLVFLSRLANNEALYLHRETPPSSNTLHRVLLIDATLKNWGNPKTMAFALAIAVARHPKTDIPCTVYVVDDEYYYPVSIKNKETIIEALQIVKGGLHAGGGLEAFFKVQGATTQDRELFFITEASTIRQPGLLRVLNEHQQHVHYLVHTESNGNLDVYKKQGSSKKHLQHLRVPLEKLWEKPKASIAPQNNEPVKYHINLPILLAGETNDKKFLMTAGGEVFLVTNEKALMRLFHKENPGKRGWDLVYNNLPFVPDLWEVGLTQTGEYVVLLFNRNTREAVILNLQSGQRHSVYFNQWRSALPHFIFNGRNFIHETREEKWSISTTGELTKTTEHYPDDFKERKDKAEALARQLPTAGRFKNIKSVWINHSNGITFNDHALQLTVGDKKIGLITILESRIKAMAEKISDQLFQFADGSVVELNRCGFATLRSSDRLIPTIYLPTTLTGTIALATSKEFAGNWYYFKEPIYNLELTTRPSAQRLSAVRILKHWTGLGLKEAKDAIDQQPSHVIQMQLPKSRAEQFREEMNNAGVTVGLTLPENTSDMTELEPEAFLKKHVNRFVQTVLNHGAKANTAR